MAMGTAARLRLGIYKTKEWYSKIVNDKAGGGVQRQYRQYLIGVAIRSSSLKLRRAFYVS
jgi:hypothetical protein